MAILDTRIPGFKKQRDLQAEWADFRGGLNMLLRPTELKQNEMAQADNIILVGSGVPTGRWGTMTYFTANATGAVRGFASYKNTASLTNEIIAFTDEGYLCKKTGASYTRLVGQSYPSGSYVRSEQLGGITAFVSKDRPLTTYTGGSLSVFATLSVPTGLTATNISGVSGSNTYSWKVVALSTNGGHTTPSTNIVLSNLPSDLTRTQINIAWTAPSTASGALAGYEIYRGLPGDETYLSVVGASVTLYSDLGDSSSESILPPLTNTTGGVKSNLIAKTTDRLLMVDVSDPSKLIISGRFPNHLKFNWADGGGYIYVDPDSDDKGITAITTQPGSDRIIVFKENSVYAVQLSTVNIGNFAVLDPQVIPISTAIGCSSPDTVETVENDVFYFGRKGLYVVGYEPNFLSIIRTNEISARMRPYLDTLSSEDYRTATAFYVNNKYVLSFPNRKECIVYDRERGCFVGVWKLPFGITSMIKYTDSSGTERWVIGSGNSNQVYAFEASVNSDDGTTITKTIRTRKEDFGSWSILKIIKMFYILFRRITGSVTINLLLEDRTGATTTVKTITLSGSAIAGASGWGVDTFGSIEIGDTQGTIVVAGDEDTRWSQLFKSGRLIQVEVSCTAANSNFELLGIRMTANSQGEGSLASSRRV